MLDLNKLAADLNGSLGKVNDLAGKAESAITKGGPGAVAAAGRPQARETWSLSEGFQGNQSRGSPSLPRAIRRALSLGWVYPMTWRRSTWPRISAINRGCTPRSARWVAPVWRRA